MKNDSTFSKYIKPIIVLVGICLVVSTALAAIYGMTEETIAEINQKIADETRQAVLPDADGFKEVSGEFWGAEDGKAVVTQVFEATNGCGYVMTVETKSFGGALTMMVGIDTEGKITGVSVTDHADTPGVGTKAHAESHLAQYEGISELDSTNAKKDSHVDHVSGATVSSNAVHYGVYAALQQFNEMGGAK